MITIFTPTYNRLNTIVRLYQSLCNQTLFDFEWLVIDDGSTDETENFFQTVTMDKFPIVYKKKCNGGKHRAINDGLDLAKGELFFVVDSDDYLAPNCIETIKEMVQSLPENHTKWCGIAGLRVDPKLNIIGTTFNGEFLDCSAIDRSKNNINGDKSEIFFTDIFRKYKFKEFDGENFITEDSVYMKMAQDGYILRWFNKKIYVCDYQDNGISANQNLIKLKNPNGTLYSTKLYMEVFKNNKKTLYSKIYTYYDIFKGTKKKKSICRDLNISIFKLHLIILVRKIYRIIK